MKYKLRIDGVTTEASAVQAKAIDIVLAGKQDDEDAREALLDMMKARAHFLTEDNMVDNLRWAFRNLGNIVDPASSVHIQGCTALTEDTDRITAISRTVRNGITRVVWQRDHLEANFIFGGGGVRWEDANGNVRSTEWHLVDVRTFPRRLDAIYHLVTE